MPKGSNYTADDDTFPTNVEFENGRKVSIGTDPNGKAYLVVGMVEKEKPLNHKEAVAAAVKILEKCKTPDNSDHIDIVVKSLTRTRKVKAPTAAATEQPAAQA